MSYLITRKSSSGGESHEEAVDKLTVAKRESPRRSQTRTVTASRISFWYRLVRFPLPHRQGQESGLCRAVPAE